MCEISALRFSISATYLTHVLFPIALKLDRTYVNTGFLTRLCHQGCGRICIHIKDCAPPESNGSQLGISPVRKVLY